MTWKEALNTSRYRWALAFCAATLLWMFLFVPFFYRDILTPKQGLLLDDYVLGFFTPIDLSLYIFIILYAATAQTILSHWNDPEVIIVAATVYVAMNIVRTATMYLLTLEPPTGIILLQDPISSLLYPDTGFAKDLFFSGHISTIMVTVFVERNAVARWLKTMGAAVMAILLAWQHVHYSIDLVVAPVATYAVFLIVRRALKSSYLIGKSN